MAELSPAAQASVSAAMAAALRTAVNQANPKFHIEDIDYQHQSYVDGWKDALDVILVIAAELDNTSPPSK
jgi:hypothetical protein